MEFDRKSAHFGAFSALLEQNLEKVKSGDKWKSTPWQMVGVQCFKIWKLGLKNFPKIRSRSESLISGMFS